MENKYVVKLVHEYGKSQQELKGEILVSEGNILEGTLISNGPNGEEIFKIIGQMTRSRLGTILAFTKAHDSKLRSNIIYGVNRFGFDRNLGGVYRGYWHNLENGLVIPVNDFKIRALQVIEEIPTHSLQHRATLDLHLKI